MDDLTAIPATLTAGDSYAITLSLSDYPATAGWSVEFALVGPSAKVFTSSASGDSHVLALAATETTGLPAGTYAWRLRASLSTTAETFQSGALEVLPDLASVTAGGLSRLAYWEALKAAAENALLALMDGGAVQMATILGRQTMFRSPKDCFDVIATCEARIQATKSNTFGTPVRFDVVGMR